MNPRSVRIPAPGALHLGTPLLVGQARFLLCAGRLRRPARRLDAEGVGDLRGHALEGDAAVRGLRAPLGRSNDESGRPMRQPDAGFDFVPVLPTRAAGDEELHVALAGEVVEIGFGVHSPASLHRQEPATLVPQQYRFVVTSAQFGARRTFGTILKSHPANLRTFLRCHEPVLCGLWAREPNRRIRVPTLRPGPSAV